MSLLKASKVSKLSEGTLLTNSYKSSEISLKQSNLFGVPAILSQKNSSEFSQDYTMDHKCPPFGRTSSFWVICPPCPPF